MAASLTKTQSYTASEWETQTSGQALTPTLTGGDALWIRQTLETTDTSVTPTLSLMEIELIEQTDPVVTTKEATNTSLDSADLNGDLEELGQYASVDVYFEYRIQGETTWNTTTAETLSSSQTFQHSLSSLTENATYEFRAVATADGNVFNGDVLTFITALSEVHTISVLISEKDSILASFYKSIAKQIDVDSDSEIGINFYKSSKKQIVIDDSSSTATDFYKEITLSVGIEEQSEIIIEIQDIVYPDVVTDSAININTTSATLVGEIIAIGQKTTWVDVFFEWRLYGETEWNHTPSQTFTTTGEFQYTITGLEINKKYEFRAVIAW